jgi:OPT family small oligopeptide transporter
VQDKTYLKMGQPETVDDQIVPAVEEVQDIVATFKDTGNITPEMRSKIAVYYGRKAEEDNLAPQVDIHYILDRIVLMTHDEAIDILVNAIQYHSDDPNFPDITMQKIRLLVQGPKASGLDSNDYDFDLKAEAAIIHFHSPYPEVRSVTEPFDDPDEPVETIRSYFLGLVWMAGSTALNTFFSPRQPAVSIHALVLQLLLAPCGLFLARVLPDWGFTFRGQRVSLNPGPWSYKEQMFATIIFTIGNSAGGVYYVYLVQRLPQYLDRTWVTFGYEIILALSTQFFGFGFAGLLRRFVIYPITAIWPKVLPTLALNRALILPEKKGERVNRWTLTRYQFFLGTFALMFVYFWLPNSLFQALHSFNWMTWIAPQNFNLGMITGFYGGMGFNPIATFDWNVAGTQALVTPFFSQVQQYAARVISGIIIIAMYYGNMYWSAYMPINSNESFANDGTVYNVTKILDSQAGVDVEAYKSYGPPYFSGANVFGQGAWFAWYPMTLFYYSIRYWSSMKRAVYEMYRAVRYREPAYERYTDAHCRMMQAYKEVADWWFLLVLLISLVLGIVALKVYPVDTPVWTLFAIAGLSAVFLVPSAMLVAGANVTMGFNVLFQLLAGVWFVGNPEALIIVTAYGQNYNYQADNYISNQKMAHYAKLPPRAVFRGQMISAFLNCFVFIGMLNWMIYSFDNGTLCTWSNSQHFVCTDAVLVFASAIEYGAFGVKNFFQLYPILPWCFLIGTVIGVVWGVAHKYGPSVRDYARRTVRSEDAFDRWERYLFRPASLLAWFDPAVFWNGALNWTGGNNLSYATNVMYISFIFMYYIKRHYSAWWEKYNYLLEAGFDVGVAVSAIIQTFAFAFTGITISWWGNNVSQQGLDYQSYNQNSTLLPLPPDGYFGLAPADYPMQF